MATRTGRPWREKVVPRILERDGYICHLCGQPGTTNTMTADHLLPVSKGGSWYDEDNLAAAHRTCNLSRGDRPVEVSRHRIQRTTKATPEWTW